MTSKGSAVLFPALAATLQRKSVTVSVITGILFAVSTALIGLGGPLEDAADTRQVVAGIVAFAIGTLLGIAREWAQWWVDRGQELAAAQFRIAVKDALRPVAELIAGMPSLTPRDRKGRLKEVAKQVTGSMELLLTDVAGLCTVVYELRDNGNRLEQIGYSGRGEAPEAFQRRPQANMMKCSKLWSSTGRDWSTTSGSGTSPAGAFMRLIMDSHVHSRSYRDRPRWLRHADTRCARTQFVHRHRLETM